MSTSVTKKNQTMNILWRWSFVTLVSASFFLLTPHIAYTQENEDPYINMIFPNGGEILDPNEDYSVRWEQSGIERVHLKIYDINQPSTIWVIENFETNTSTQEKSFELPAGRLRCGKNKQYIVDITGISPTSESTGKRSRVEDTSDSPFLIYIEDHLNVEDAFVEIVEPFDREVYMQYSDPMRIRVRHNDIDFFKIFVEGNSNNLYPKAVEIEEGLTDLYFKINSSRDVFNASHKIIVKGAKNINPCPAWSNDEWHWVSDTSEGEIFFVKATEIKILDKYKGDLPTVGYKHHDTQRSRDFFEGDNFSFRWWNSWDVAKVGISFQPVLYHRQGKDVYRRYITKNIEIPKNGLSYAGEHSYNWVIPEGFFADLPKVNYFGKDDRRFFYTIHGYDESGNEITSAQKGVIEIWDRRGDEIIEDTIAPTVPKEIVMYDRQQKVKEKEEKRKYEEQKRLAEEERKRVAKEKKRIEKEKYTKEQKKTYAEGQELIEKLGKYNIVPKIKFYLLLITKRY